MALDLGHTTAADQIAQSVAHKVTMGSAFAGFLGWLAEINWIGLSAVLIGLCGFAANVYFQHRRDKREQKESELRIADLKRRVEDDDSCPS